MNPLRIALCEDEVTEQEHLRRLLENSNYETEVTVFSSGEDFLKAFVPNAFDLILMDIFMEGMTGIEAITQVRLQDRRVSVAFITSSMEFTRESYQLDAVKYIEKPAVAQQVSDLLQLAQLKQQTMDGITLRSHNTTKTYPLQQVLYLEQQGRNLQVYFLGGEVVSTLKKLSQMEEELSGKGFLRCHKSYLVNLDYVRGIDRDRCTFEMVEGRTVYIRRRSFWEMQKAFEAHLFNIS